MENNTKFACVHTYLGHLKISMGSSRGGRQRDGEVLSLKRNGALRAMSIGFL
jgi:hypothetical protein